MLELLNLSAMLEAPSYHSSAEFCNRSRKLASIRSFGIEPYPAEFKPSISIEELLKELDAQPLGNSEEALNGATRQVTLAGRLILFRPMGKNAFGQIQDDGAKIQVMFNRDVTSVMGLTQEAEQTALKFIEKELDLGDFIGAEGHLFRTQKGEITLFVKKATLLCKSLLPLPDKHSGLVDKELRYRKRWLDLLGHEDVATTFKTRSYILDLIRCYFKEHKFMEVETPVLQNVYGGAEARPFTTHLHALENQEVYLRISLEIPLKKLIAGGFRRVFEIGKVFRNEGLDKTHNPEFTMMEAYAAYWDYNDAMSFVEKLFERVATQLFGEPKVLYPHPHTGELVTVDLKAPWVRMTMQEALAHYGKIEIDELSAEEMRAKLRDLGTVDPAKYETAPRGALIALLFGELVEQHLMQPHHIIDHPIETTPLCKMHRSPQARAKGLVERFETFIICHEFCNSYSELNDPQLQRELLVQQALKRAKGDVEASPLDEEFIEAVCQGMPPTAGLGIGIDRMVMLFTRAISIRDVLYFPIMKPE